MAQPWNADDPGVVELPSGRRVRARSLRQRSEPPPSFGVYLSWRRPRGLEWEHRWIRCPDFWVPDEVPAFMDAIEELRSRSAHEPVEVGCPGGVGRTGLALGALAILDGVPPPQAVEWVRQRHHPRSVETPWQRRWLLGLTRS